MKMKFNIVMMVALAFGAGCGGDEASDQLGSAQEAQALAEQIVGGSAKSAEKDGDVWEVLVTMQNGATVTVELGAEEGTLLELEDKKGPFDYDITPGAGFKSYGAARDIAVVAVSGDTVDAWNLRPLTSSSEQDEDEEEDEELSADPSHYRYEFYTTDRDGQLWEVKLDAETGKILSEEKKTEID